MAATVGSLRIELSANIAQFQTDMGKAADSLKQLSGQAQAFGNDFKKVGAQLQGVGLALSKTLTLPLVAISASVFKVGTDFEDAFAGVKKTVAGSAADLQGISDAFRDMAKTIPTSASELAKIGEIAGQLGISKENVVDFTKTISQIATVTTLSTEEAATEFAKLANILHVPKTQFESLGSAVYSLGNFGASTEQEMLAMAQRIAGAGAAAGLNAPEVLGLANALASVGLDAEAGGTAMSKIILKIATAAHDGGKALDQFAKVAGVSSAQFKQDFQTNASSAIVEFIQGLGNIKKSGGDLIGTIQELGFKEVRLRDATLRMAQAGDLVADSVALGTKAFGDHSEFLGAVQERYKTTSNELKVLGNRIADVGITLFTALKPAIEAGISLVETLLPYLDSMAKAFASLPGGVQLSVIGVFGFAAAIGPAIWFAGQMVSSLGQLTLAFGKNGIATRGILGSIGLVEKAMQALGSATLVDGAVMFEWGKSTVAVGGWVGKLGAAIGSLVSSGLGPLSGALELAGGALAALFSPVTLVVGGFLALGLAVAVATGHWNDVKAAMGGAISVVQDLGTVLGYLAKGVLADVVTGLISLAKWLGGEIVSGFQWLVSTVGALIAPLTDLATLVAGPVITAFKDWGSWIAGNVASLFGGMIGWVGKLASATKDLAVKSVKDLHDYAEAVRLAAENAAFGKKFVDDFWASVDTRGKLKEVQSAADAFALLKKQLSGLSFGAGGSNGFADLMNSLKAARAELAALSSTDLARLTEAIKSGAFSMKEIEQATGLSDMALKIFQGQVRETAKELKAANSIFAEYDKQEAEAVTALTEGFSAVAPIEFIKKAFGSLITEVVEKAGALGKTVRDIIKEGFLQITMKDATDKLQKEFVKFGEDLNHQVGKDMERVNATVIKTLGVIVEAGNSTADSVAQFSIQGLQNEIKNLEATNGETKKSHDLRKQLAAEEYQYQVTLIQREAQTKKDALDATVMDYEDYNKAVDAIEEATAAKMGLLSQKYQQSVKENAASTKRWTDSLGDLASALSAIASSSTGAFSETIKEIGGIVSALGTAVKAAKEFTKATEEYKIAVASGDVAGQYAAIGNKVVAIANGIAAVAQATGSKSKAGAVIGGAITGAQVGSVIPGVGTAIGAGVGALVGYIRAVHKGPAEKAAIDVGRDFGVNISEGLAKELGELRKTIGQQAAGIFDLDKIIAEGGGLRSNNIQQYTAKLRDTFVLVKTGALSAADGAVVLDKNFASFANEFLAHGPLISRQLVEIVRLTDDLGVSSKAVSDFINKQVTGTILPGLKAYTDASTNANKIITDNEQKIADLKDKLSDKDAQDLAKVTDLKKKMAKADAIHAASYKEQIDNIIAKQSDQVTQIEKLNDAIDKQKLLLGTVGVTSQAAADALSATVAVSFAEMMKAGTPILDIVNQLEPVVAALGKQFDAAGFSGGAAFANIKKLVGVAADEIAGPAIQAATGLGQALAGLSNIGQLNQETFSGLSDQIASTFNNLVSQGQDSASVLALMQGPLQTIWALSTEFGYSVDAATKGLLDQALAAGVVGEKFKGPQQQMIDALTQTNSILGSIARALGATLPAAVQQGADGVNAAFTNVNPQVRVDINYNDPGFTPSPPGGDYTPPTSNVATGGYVTPMGVQHFDQGGLVKGLFQPKGTDTVPAMLTPGELVLNRQQQAAYLQGSDGLFHNSQLADQRASAQPAPASDPITVHMHINALDAGSFRDMMNRPGGGNDMLIENIAQGKRGRDEKLRRALAFK